ncbi:zinc finger protein 518A [Piliocolobus tephrosceles]|uniref:Zinc finger protein 518A n=1 Tax=Piliocolobus tephrosceles TaxID=591936 RepID=A0A8C9IDX6_9PRIM|nr:zinc finger protein 518A [Piliocolobus tephrosceles]XP_023062026.2 zinc finger protein 518A [Piliocolobus tephrosceles]XP_023062027.2 zinc finger protein 518A [Piliocolobus tephrosceles]XP_023062028.2 zinc finger protein 518A [Piliocolobus tephrosceles]XP_023062029.2 zinc finger protein 518A [Piliocolobus tephrosceles]XP_023062030.2 zinc finger protein 518A [Piliocolobus tephrosceles]XP_023062031.2 zinc finger protein 518A [Piliocolobus tephrosceles]XP_023062032.2 zinc finger protein 518A
MPSEQKELFCDEKQTTLKKEYDVKNEIVDRSVLKPKISESIHYELKNVKIHLPKINIPNEVLLKHEVDKYRKLFQSKQQTARKSISIKTVSCVEECTLLHKSERAEEEGIKMSAKILNFSCLKCRDNTRYSPNDLQKHFQMWHHGELPSYPCEMCSFSANDFQVFKQHRRTHRSTLVKCDICNNESVYTLLNLTKHFTSTHCVNGNFQCEKCKFSTQDVGTFVQHIHRHNEIHYKCGKCHHVCFTKGELQKHLHIHSGTFPFTCQYCSYGATKREHLVRHVITLHKEHLYAKEKLEKDKYEKRMAKTSAGLKLILKRYKIGASRKTFWKRKKINSGSDRIVEKNTQVLQKMKKPQTKSEDQSHVVQEHLSEEKDEGLHCESNDKAPESESEKPTPVSTGQGNRAEEGPNASSGFMKTAVLGPTLFMLKNNRGTVPPNYSAKFMGFRMMDGKQHILLKLVPIKQNTCSPDSHSGAAKDSTANLQPQTLDTNGFLTGVTTELNDTVYMKAATPFSCSSSILSGKASSEKEMTLVSQRNNKLQTVDNEKSVSSLSTMSELVTSSVNLTTKFETRDNVDFWGNHLTQSHPEVLGTTIKSPDKVNCVAKPNAYSSGDMHNYCINYVNSELPVESSNQGSLPFHNYSKVNNSNKRRRFSGTAVYENPQRECSSSKTAVQQPISESFLSLVRQETSKPDSLLASISLLNDKDGTLKAKSEIEEQYILEKGQNIDGQNLYSNENQNLECATEKSKWDDFSNVDSPMMPRITSVFSLQSQQASEFLPPEVNQLLQDVLKIKPDVKQDSSNTPNKSLPLHCDQSFQKHEGESKIVESSKDFKVQRIFPVPPGSVGINVPTNDLNLKFGKEKQVPSMPQDVRDSEKMPRISGFGTLLKTQSDAIITQQLVKDKLRATTQNLGSFYMQSPLLNSEQKKTIIVQTSKGFLIPLNITNKPGLPVIPGNALPLVNSQGIPASLVVNKKPGMILTLNNGKLEGVSAVKTEGAQAHATMTKEPCKTPILKVEPNNNCLTPGLCSSIGSCLSMKSSSENTLPLKGPYILKPTSSVKAVLIPNMLSEQQSTKLNISDSVKQQNEIFPKPPLYTFLPDGKQAVLLKCVMPNKTELLKPKLVQNSTYQNIQPKKPEGTPQRILLKIFNPVLNVTAANNLSVSNSASSLQKDNVPSNQIIGGEQKEPESSRDALPFLLDDLMPANEIVITSTATCPESSEEPICVSDCSESRVLRCKTNCTVERNFNRKKTSKKIFSKTKTHGSKDSETAFVSKNRNCKRKCRDSYQEPPRRKATLHRKCKEKAKPEDVRETYGFSRPRLSKDSVRTLRLFPFSSKQLVKCPRRNQPVVVLNHPDADAPEVVSVMKTIAKFNGHVLKVSLSKRTINALLKPVCYNSPKTTCDDFSKRHKTFKPVSSVKERFVLKLTLKKTSKNNYQIVKTTSENILKAKFNCWFCGRVFDNQDTWAGHGQRHLMEATRDWNMLE